MIKICTQNKYLKIKFRYVAGFNTCSMITSLVINLLHTDSKGLILRTICPILSFNCHYFCHCFFTFLRKSKLWIANKKSLVWDPSKLLEYENPVWTGASTNTILAACGIITISHKTESENGKIILYYNPPKVVIINKKGDELCIPWTTSLHLVLRLVSCHCTQPRETEWDLLTQVKFVKSYYSIIIIIIMIIKK